LSGPNLKKPSFVIIVNMFRQTEDDVALLARSFCDSRLLIIFITQSRKAAKPQRRRLSLSSSLCGFAALRENIVKSGLSVHR
jgi:hypothetical protein